MLGVKAYNQAYSYKEYQTAEDYSDLLTAFANDLEQVEANYMSLHLHDRKRKFEPTDSEEAQKHSIATPIERHIDVALQHLCNWVVEPSEPTKIQAIFDKRIKGWNDTAANRLEAKIDNAKAIIAWFQKRYPIVLRRSFYFENNHIYVGNGMAAALPSGSNYTLAAKILFRDIHRAWSESELFKELCVAKGIALYTPEYDELKKLSLKRICQHINGKVSEACDKKTKLITYIDKRVSFNLDLFHQIDRVISK